jgi:SAM-dependent methyltransferase
VLAALLALDRRTASASTCRRSLSTTRPPHPRFDLVVANVDRRIPLAGGSVDLVLSVHARRNAAECARARPHGHLIVAVPAPDDLIELREAVQGQRPKGHDVERDRADQVIREHAAIHDRQSPRRARAAATSARRAAGPAGHDAEAPSAAQKVRTLDALDVTLATEVVISSGTDGDVSGLALGFRLRACSIVTALRSEA